MSIITTESFTAFNRLGGTDAEINTQENRDAIAAAAARVGHVNVATTNGTWFFGNHPVNPERAALISCVQSPANAQERRYFIPLPQQLHPLIVGFNLFIPAELPEMAALASTFFRVYLGSEAMASATVAALAPTEAFNIAQDRRVRRGNSNGTPQSQRQAIRGGMSYVEMRYGPDALRVWLDDALVYEDAGAALAEGGIIFSTLNQAAPSGLAIGPQTRWAISDFYAISQDARAPNVRLGPTTRVIGARPTADVFTSFLRPSGTPSNASVVAQPVGGSLPTNTLQTEEVGARDEYDVAWSPEVAGAQMVHGMVTKVIAGNLESAPHKLRPWVKSGSEEGADEDIFEFSSGFTGVSMRSVAQREDGVLIACGAGPSIFTSSDGGDTWVPRYNGQVAGITANDIAVGPDGTTMACCSNGTILINLPTDSLDVWTSVSSGGTAVLNAIAVSPAGNWCASSATIAQNAVKLGNAAWKIQSRHNAACVNWVVDRFISTGAASLMYSTTGADGTWVTLTHSLTAGANIVTAGTAKIGERYITNMGSATAAQNWFRPYVYDGALPGAGSLNWVAGPTAGSTLQPLYGYTFGHSPGYAQDSSGLLIAPMPAGAIFYTRDGNYWGIFYDSKNMAGPFAKCCATQDGFVIAGSGADGRMVVMRKRKASRPLLNANGYTMLQNTVALDPNTGLSWTAAAAAATTVGMTVDE